MQDLSTYSKRLFKSSSGIFNFISYLDIQLRVQLFKSIHTGILKKPSLLRYLCLLGLLLTHDCPVGDHPGKMETNRISAYKRMFQQALHTSLLKIYQCPDVMFR